MKEVKDLETKDVVVDGDKKPIDFFSRIVLPHKVKSREVTEDDIPTILEDGKVLYNLCFTQCGDYKGAYAVHHSQINDHSPLNFFINNQAEIIINPVITRHTRHTVDSKEGCISFPYSPEQIVQRYHKIEVDFRTLTKENKLSELRHLELSGKMAFIFQHEISHANAEYIYSINK